MSLVLDIVRHAEAASSDPEGDSARPLTSRGVGSLGPLAERLRAEGWSPERVFASPLRRAQQTARLLLDGAGLALPVDTLPELEPENPPQRVIDALIAEGADRGHVAVVAHLPLVERLLALLVPGGDAAWSPGMLVRVDLPGGLSDHGRVQRVWVP